MSSIQFVPEHRFIKHVAAQVRAGFSLVPFVGSGCSSASGILMGYQFVDYLAWTVYLCVADRREHWDRDASDVGPRWDLRREGWPSVPKEYEVQAARRWALREFSELAKHCGLRVEPDTVTNTIRSVTELPTTTSRPDALASLLYAPFVPPFLRNSDPLWNNLMDGRHLRQMHTLLHDQGVLYGGLVRPDLSPTSVDAIVERAVRSLYDWRATLHFLAELELGFDGHSLALVEPDQAVIDGFNVHITQGRRPNLTHTMLCHLREPARARIVLTTNFDTLIEDAYAEQHRRIDSISVSLKGALPDPEIVHARDTVVKLHGTFSETRADFSLDDPPSLEDKRKFFHYVRGHQPGSRGDGRFLPGHLLVAGYSGLDARCVQLMKYVLDSDPGALLFWVCYNDSDAKRLEKLFPERGYLGRIISTRSERIDLLLYEFYQYLCLSLPPGGAGYQLNHNVPPLDRYLPIAGDEMVRPRGAEEIMRALDQIHASGTDCQSSQSTNPNMLLVVDGPSGVLPALRSVFNVVSEKRGLNKIWIELEDHADTASVAYELLQIIAMQRGLFQLRHAQFCREDLRKSIPPVTVPEEFKANRSNTKAANRHAWNHRSVDDNHTPSGVFKTRVKAWIRHLEMMQEYLEIDPKQWLIVLYGRNGPGGCFGWQEHTFWDDVVGTSVRGKLNTDVGSEYGSTHPLDAAGVHRPSTFAAFLRALVEMGFCAIYAPYTVARQQADNQRAEDLIDLLGSWNHPTAVPEKVRKRIISRTVTKTFVYPVKTHDAIHFRTWMGEEGPLAGWKFLDLSEALSRDENAPSVFRETMRSMLEKELTLNRVDGETDPRERFNFYYGASLFRQSRHYTAFLSEGVMRCPKRFEPYGFDNDLDRHRKLDIWLNRLNRNPEVFHRKPGGFAWAYRDVRLGVRCLVEVVSSLVDISDQRIETGKNPKRLTRAHAARPNPAFLRKIGLLSCTKLRARTHFWIGDWYLRAFLISRHADPLMEAVYHFYQCTVHSVYSKSPNEKMESTFNWVYPMHWWRLGLIQLIKSLRMGSQALRFWFDKPQHAAWFDRDKCKQICRTIQSAIEKPEKSPMIEAIELASRLTHTEPHLEHWRDELDLKTSEKYLRGVSKQSSGLRTFLQRRLELEERLERDPLLRDHLHELLRSEPKLSPRNRPPLSSYWSAIQRAAALVDEEFLVDEDERPRQQPMPELRIGLGLQETLESEFELLAARYDQLFRVRPYKTLRGVIGVSKRIADGAREHVPRVDRDWDEPVFAQDILRYAIDYQPGVEPVPAGYKRRGPDCWWKYLRRSKPVDELLTMTESLVSPRSYKPMQHRPTDLWNELTMLQFKYFRSDPGFATLMMQQFVEWAFILLRRAKHEEHSVPLRSDSVTVEPQEASGVLDRYRIILTPLPVRGQWVRVCIFASWALDMERWLPAGVDDFCAREISKAQGIYGIALARLHRFREAHRRFTHAYAVLSRIGGPAPHVLYGVLDLRRAEANLLEANLARDISHVFVDNGGWDLKQCHRLAREDLRQEIISPESWEDKARPELSDWFMVNVPDKERREAIWQWLDNHLTPVEEPRDFAVRETILDRLQRVAAARCDDAWGCLERAERLLGGRTHSVRWWGRLRALQLRALGTVPQQSATFAARTSHVRPLSERLRFQSEQMLTKLWNDGRAAAPEDEYNRLRMLDYYIRSLKNRALKLSPENNRRLDEELLTLDPKRNPKPNTPQHSLQSIYWNNLGIRADAYRAAISELSQH